MESLLTDEQKKLRDEVRDFVKTVPRQLLLDMDAGVAPYPKQFLEEAGRRNLLGLRFPKEYGGRGLSWVDEIVALEEIGVLSTSLPCLYSLVSIVGEALTHFGTPEQNERWLDPPSPASWPSPKRSPSPAAAPTSSALRPAPVATAMAGCSTARSASSSAPRVPTTSSPTPARSENAPPHESISSFIVERGPGVEVQHVYGLMGMRGGGTGRVYFRDARVPADEPRRPGERRRHSSSTR